MLSAAGVRFAHLFGSRATGEHRPDSDADVAVLADRPLTLLQESGLALDLATSLGVPQVRRDRSPDGSVAPPRPDPRRGCGDPRPERAGARVEFEVTTRSRYFDFLPMQRATQEAYVRRVAAEGLRG